MKKAKENKLLFHIVATAFMTLYKMETACCIVFKFNSGNFL
jgi:hypothetical protein